MGRTVIADQTGAVKTEYHREFLQGDIVYDLVIAALEESRIDGVKRA